MKRNYRKSLAFACFYFVFSLTSFGQESKFHAIFLYKFIENVSWPDARKNLVVGVVGDTEVRNEFEKMLKARGNSNFTVKDITADGAPLCDVVFIASSGNSDFPSLVEKTHGKSILIVTETSDLAKKGAGISFLKDGSKLTFAINKSSLETRSLKVSVTLLTLGKQI